MKSLMTCIAMTALAGLCQAASYFSVVDGQSPLAYYRLDNLSDNEGGSSLTLNGCSVGVSTGHALTGSGGYSGFLDSNTWATAPGNTSGTLTGVATGWSSDQGSFSYWMFNDGTGDGTQTNLISRRTGGASSFSGSGDGMIGAYTRTNGTAGIKFDNIGLDSGSAVLTADAWNHLAFTWDRNTGTGDGTITVYVNGSVVASTTTATFDSFTINESRFGKEMVASSTRKFKGGVDELAIWNRTLSPTEVSAQYTAAVPEPSSISLIALGGLALVYRRRR
ncbi:PEP-CTERM sorting domain-containing protein [Verrucomicrobiaceae bacterium N1E253]|uniref:PEP-CTERM sorting domain-containing protein n=1 Tax=Oceaniferula marina TaxID=2748318 RepID=A0A851GD67_9BACT|nr:LamG-like jellyroll fold domain-containing protein [Oceaniferula marina]NWK55493.1 PEP-CTERM sorting domain-containing protein [Oceaniferula marina]